MQEGLAKLEDYPQIAVWVLKENKRAIEFYKRCGFEFDGREEEIKLGTPVVEVRMVLDRAMGCAGR